MLSGNLVKNGYYSTTKNGQFYQKKKRINKTALWRQKASNKPPLIINFDFWTVTSNYSDMLRFSSTNKVVQVKPQGKRPSYLILMTAVKDSSRRSSNF